MNKRRLIAYLLLQSFYKPLNPNKSMADNKVQMPSGMGGLVRYSDEASSKLRLKPEIVIALIALVIVLEIVIRYL